VDIYIVDSGVNVDHKEFQGRARWGFVAPGYGRQDKLGHGTHVAGLAAGKTYGVAKGANIIAVKVMGDGGAGAASDIIAGIDWAITQAVKARKASKRRSVINLSLSGPAHPGLDKMVLAALKKNIPVAIAAGNTGDNARAYSPGRVGPALTAGAIDKKYTYWHMSARGGGVDLLAPGVDVLSTWITSNVATTTLSGSSMSSPQVAGLIAYHLSLYPLLSVKRINKRLKRKATKGLIKNYP
ncbi:vacuolar serine protease, partial [Dioszegia hungarica]